MPVVLMKEIRCANCALPTRHRGIMLEQVFQRPSGSTNDAEQTYYACPVCQRVGLAEIPTTSKPFDFQDDNEHPDDAVAYLIALECDERHCESRMSVFAPVRLGTGIPELRKQVEEWLFQRDVTCSQGHRPRIPPEVAGIRSF